MKQEGADRARDCPDRKLQGGKRIALRLEHTLDQEDGGDREEDVLSEEESDVVGRRGHCADLLTLREGKRPMGALGGGLGHGGAGAAAAFLRADLIDRLLLYRAPILIGDGLAGIGDIGLGDLGQAHGRWRLMDGRTLGVDKLEVYERVRNA